MGDVFISLVSPPQERREPVLWFIFRGRKILVMEEDNVPAIPSLNDIDELGLEPIRRQYLGTMCGQHCYAVEFPESSEAPKGMVFHGLRGLHGYLKESLYSIAIRAIHVIDWDRTHKFCSQCGEKTVSRSDMRAKECPRCGFISFPRISPAVIVLVKQKNKVLLARAQRFKEELYSVIAGFVEPGETLEEVVRREVKEEAGIDVKDIRYFGSQPWPFPDSLMIAFTAEYAGGEISVDGTEILDARWFEYDKLPHIPGKISIARELIDWFVSKQEKKKKH